MIYIVGIGPGHVDYILKKAENIIKNSDYVIGFSRSIDTLESMIKGKKIKVNNYAKTGRAGLSRSAVFSI